MAAYWCIVPVNDGCSLLCRDFNNNFYIGRKENDNKEDELIFSTEKEAQGYIDKWFAPQCYKPEEFWILEYKRDSAVERKE